jgi:hypothetical protein
MSSPGLPSSRLRVVAWNINMAAEHKATGLVDLAPDIAVLAEVADVPELGGGALVRIGWAGRNPRKGLGVFARPGLVATVDPSWDPVREWFLPIHVELAGGIDILAVWAMNHRGQESGPRLGRTHRALDHYGPLLARNRTLVIGDFNDNAQWDTPRYPAFARTVGILADAGYVSLYHARTGEAQGGETGASLYWYRHRDRPYLVDHAFVPASWLPQVRSFELGDPDRWLSYSDHVPLIVELAMPLD